ncbi:MAG TPA: polysaccharide deacetylase family protein [Solirubrobacteraceae bacterium]|nr:polysaccharide deacetylase family protein [Solirubrobacteraceae bacterium]
MSRAEAERASLRTLAAGVLAPVVPAAAGALGLPRRLSAAAGVALTFDDGPHPEGTPAVLELLAREELRAAFFLVGEQVERRPALAARIAGAGHLVALHGYRHQLQLRMRHQDAEADLRRGAAVIEDAVGARPRWHRPPYGIYSPWGLEIARGAGLSPLLWSRWGKDWRRFTTPARIAARATRELAPGDVILLHDADFYSSRHSHRRTLAALGLIVAELKRCGLDTVLPV